MTTARFRKQTPEEKKNEILTTGKQITLFTCPLCAKSSSINLFETTKNIKELPLLDVRRTGGKGSGFYRELQHTTLDELKNEAEYQYTISVIRKRCKQILNIIGDQ